MRCFLILAFGFLCIASSGCFANRSGSASDTGRLRPQSLISLAKHKKSSRDTPENHNREISHRSPIDAGRVDNFNSSGESNSRLATTFPGKNSKAGQEVSLATFNQQTDSDDEKQNKPESRESSRRKSANSNFEKAEASKRNLEDPKIAETKNEDENAIEPDVQRTYSTDDQKQITQPYESTNNSYSLNDVEQWALAHNPSLAVAQAAICKAQGLRNQVGLLPNPTLGISSQQLADAGTDQHLIFVEREFVRGDKLRLNREVLAQTTLAQQRELETQQHRVMTDVRVLFYEAIAAQQQVEAARLLQSTAKRGVEIARDRLNAEEGTRIEVLQSETLLSEITLTVERTEIAYRAAWKELAAISGLPSTVPIQLVGDLGINRKDLEWDVVYEQINLQSPELATARAIVCEKSALVRRQQVQAIPNLTGQLGAGYDNGTSSGMINVQVSAPIPTVNKNHGNISAANADYQLAAENVRRIEQSIKSRLARVAQEYESALASVNKYENEIIPQSASGLELSETAYKAGELDFLQVLILRRSYFESSIRLIESKSQLAQAHAKIEGLLLTGGLAAPQDYTDGDGIRGTSFGGQ